MRAIGKWFVTFVTRLCAIFTVTPDSLVKDKRGNLPPPDGGMSAY
ncbi:hypothetical protein SAMN05444161_0520 [Rhizobiales bacterium GAS191]|jgi:hypothetical protein|nr:hypothetical protein SAMN05444161_0520 [Rhizobiales bacterium GAS191]